ncbi:hypothetical protein KF840_19105 [bacterium]|nr:hypothetical protein [bacterium]
MQMVVLIFRKSLEHDVLAVLRACEVHSFTRVPEVWGAGETGVALHTFARPGFNAMALVALAEPEVARIVAALRRFRDRAAAQQEGAKVPLHVFLLPCEQVL